MPITKDRFETLQDGDVNPGTNAATIVEFLLRNQDYAFRMTELADETGLPRGSVGPTLNRLEANGLVVHRNKYWTIDDTYAASRSAVALTSEAATDYDDGKEFDIAAWVDAAEDTE